MTIASAATLAGTGIIGGPLTLNGHLSPGVGANNTGTITLGATNLATGSNLDYDLSSLSNDSAHVGTLTLGGSLNVNLNLMSGFTLGTYTLVSSTGITGSPSFVVSHSGPGDNPNFSSLYSVAKQGNNIVLIVAAPVQTWKGNTSALWNTTDVNWTPTSLNGGKYADNLYQEVFDDNGSANPSISIPSDVSPLAVKFANTGAVTYSITGPGVITGPAVVVVQGPGTVNLNLANTYTGGTNLLGGTLNIGNSAALGAGTLTISGGSIDNTAGSVILGNSDEVWAGSFTFVATNNFSTGGGPVTLVATPTVTVANATSTVRIDGSIGDGGNGFGFTKDGPGTMLLASANTYSGTTTLAAGSLVLGFGSTLGGGAAPLTVTGGTLDMSFSTQNVGAVNISAGAIQNGTLHATSYAVNNPADLTLDSSLILAGTGGLTKTGAGTLTLAGTNTYIGGTTINQGTVSISADANLGSADTLTLNGGTLLVTAGTAANAGAGFATISAARGITLGSNGGTISIGFTNPTLTLSSETAIIYNGVITGPGGLTVIGQAGIDQAQQSILDLGAVATYQGSTTINSAVVEINSGNTGTTATGANPLVNVLPTGTVLNLINNGAWNIDSSTSSLTIGGLTGDATGRFGTTNQGSFATLTISGAGTNTFPGIIGAFTVAGKLGVDSRLGLIEAGTGTQILSGANTYTGGTTVTSGTITTTSTGTIGNGFLTVSAADTVTSIMNIGSNQPITSLSGTVAGSGSARVNVAAGTTLTDNQGTSTTYAGVLGLTAGATAHSGGTLAMTGTATLEIQGAPSLGNNSNINVSNTGTLRFNVTAGSATIGTGVLATVSDTATLELAGTVSALGTTTPGHRVDVANNSAAAAGLHVTGTNQQVGGIDGTGTTQVEASSDLTANHIVQGALVIGGDATHPSLVTIAASDASGNSLASAGGFALAGSLGSSDPLASSSLGSSSLLAAGSSSSGSVSSVGGASGGMNLGGGAAAVPEPSTMLLLAFGSLGCLAASLRRRVRSNS